MKIFLQLKSKIKDKQIKTTEDHTLKPTKVLEGKKSNWRDDFDDFVNFIGLESSDEYTNDETEEEE